MDTGSRGHPHLVGREVVDTHIRGRKVMGTHIPPVYTSVGQPQVAARQSPSDRAALADGQARRKSGRTAAPGGAWSGNGFRLGSCRCASRGAVNWPHRPDYARPRSGCPRLRPGVHDCARQRSGCPRLRPWCGRPRSWRADTPCGCMARSKIGRRTKTVRLRAHSLNPVPARPSELVLARAIDANMLCRAPHRPAPTSSAH